MIFTTAVESLVGHDKVKKICLCVCLFLCVSLQVAIDWKEMTPMFNLNQSLFSTLGNQLSQII